MNVLSVSNWTLARSQPSRREKIIGRELGIQLVLTGFLIAHRPISESDSSVLFRSLTENETRKAIQGIKDGGYLVMPETQHDEVFA